MTTSNRQLIRITAELDCPHCNQPVRVEMPAGVWPGSDLLAVAVWQAHPPSACASVRAVPDEHEQDHGA